MNENSHEPAQTAAEKPHAPSRFYDKDFALTDAYPCGASYGMQNADTLEIFGANVPILGVGISNFRLPLRYITAASDTHTLETSVTGTVSLEANQRINMSRIMRVFYTYQERVFAPELLREILIEYKEEIKAHRAQLKLSFEYPIMKPSLRSGLEGWQYYHCAFEGRIDRARSFPKIHSLRFHLFFSLPMLLRAL